MDTKRPTPAHLRQPRAPARGATLTYWYGGRKGRRQDLVTRLDALSIHSTPGWNPAWLRRLVGKGGSARALAVVLRVPEVGITVVSAAGSRHPTRALARLAALLARDKGVRRTDVALWDASTRQYVYSCGEIVVRFSRAMRLAAARRTLAVRKGATLIGLPFARGGFLWNPGLDTPAAFDAARALLARRGVLEAYPTVARPVKSRMPSWFDLNAFVFPTPRHRAARNDWHLRRTQLAGEIVDAGANVVAAWSITRGRGAKVALIDDDGIDIDHPELSGNKVCAHLDVTAWPQATNPDPRPRHAGFAHGTPCAGVAVGWGRHASGVAPHARLIAIRSAAGLGSPGEAYAFYAADLFGADVILCPWGPPDQPAGVQHDLPPCTEWAIEHVTKYGRQSRGCVVVFAAGNGGGDDIAFDGYASHPDVLAIGACNSTGARAVLSDIGARLFALFPSGDTSSDEVHCIWVASTHGDPDVGCAASTRGGYLWSAGGTSTASSGAAGIAALVIAARPSLRRRQVVRILRRCCDQIEASTAGYGASGHSLTHGYGRLNAYEAVLQT